MLPFIIQSFSLSLEPQNMLTFDGLCSDHHHHHHGYREEVGGVIEIKNWVALSVHPKKEQQMIGHWNVRCCAFKNETKVYK